MTRTIVIWYDDISRPGEPTWCVSLCDDDGEIQCLSTHEREQDAVEAGMESGRDRGLGVFSRDKFGRDEKIEETA